MTGVSETGVIDLITMTPSEEVKLIMIENRKWDSSDVMYEELQDKLNNYLVYIEDGQLEKDYPESVGKKIIIQLDASFKLTEYASKVVDKISEVLSSRNIVFQFNLVEK